MLSCEEAREQIDIILDDDLEMNSDTSEHLKSCAGCRRHFESLQRLELRLRGAASSHTEELSHEVSGRAMKLITEGETRHVGFWFYGLSAACILILGIAIGSHFTPREQPPVVNTKPKTHSAPSVDLVPAFAAAPEGSSPISMMLAAPDQALRSEREKLSTDVRSVESFLLRCLPGKGQ